MAGNVNGTHGNTGLEDSLRNMILRNNEQHNRQPHHISHRVYGSSPHHATLQSPGWTPQIPPGFQHPPPPFGIHESSQTFVGDLPNRGQHLAQRTGLSTRGLHTHHFDSRQSHQGVDPGINQYSRNAVDGPRGHPRPPQHYGANTGRGRGKNQFHRSLGTETVQLDASAFDRGGRPPQKQLYNPRVQQPRSFQFRQAAHEQQAAYLEDLACVEVPKTGMPLEDLEEKESFRALLSQACQEVCEANPEKLPSVTLESFGSVRTGFASVGSDMDLVIVVKNDTPTEACFDLHESGLPRSLEKKLLMMGIGARLLSKTRVPIIKICQRPDELLLSKLREERERWDMLDEASKYPHLHPVNDDESGAPNDPGEGPAVCSTTDDGSRVNVGQSSENGGPTDAGSNEQAKAGETAAGTDTPQREPKSSVWTRERKSGPLDFPKDGVGVQCDINFFNPLGLHNTQLLRCYSLCDPRVRPMILFVKLWAKQRKINSSYSGTLSSYGYVLMVLHYLINIAQPRVLPNLQHSWRPRQDCTPHGASRVDVDGWTVDFWRNEDEIRAAAATGELTANHETLGSLLAGFYEYYSSLGGGRYFHWTKSALSLRSQHGVLSKEEKGWVKASTEEVDGKRIQHRYLLAIEDPFELTHNVARTVTHNGIVAIRDEFRRAYRILQDIGMGAPATQHLLAPITEDEATTVYGAGQAKKADERSQEHRGSARGGQNSVEPTTSNNRQRAEAPRFDMASQDLFPALPSSTPQRN